MRRAARQAARHTGRLLHAVVQLAVGIVVAAAVVLSLLSWRLAQGPLELPWLAQRLEQAVNDDGTTHLSLGGAALTWEGFRSVDRPLDITVTDAVANDADGQRIAAVPQAELSLSVEWLLLGRLVPRAVEVHNASFSIVHGADGSLSLDLGTHADRPSEAKPAPEAVSGAQTAETGQGPLRLIRELARPAAGDHAIGRTSRWSQLRRVRIRGAEISVIDRQLHATWQARGLTIDLDRRREGGVTGSGHAALALGGQTADLTMTAALGADTGHTSLSAHLTKVMPPSLAALAPEAEKLAALDAPAVLSATAELDANLQPTNLSARAEIGAGTIHLGAGATTLLGAVLEVQGLPTQMHVNVASFDIAARPDGPATHVKAQADVMRGGDGAIRADTTLDVDALAFADLAALWPPGVGGPGARPWITRNITAGTMRNGHLEVSLAAPADLSDATVSRLVGRIEGEDATVHWLRPVPPIEQAAAHLSMTGTDGLEITFSGGRQAGGSDGGLRVAGGKVTLTGFNDPDQFADIDVDLAGSVADLVTLLRLPKIGILERSSIDLRDASGQVAGKVSVTRLPLRDQVSMDDVNLRASTRFSGLHVGRIAAGRDLDHGDIDLDVDPDGLRANGSAMLAGLAARLRLDMDFRSGPPTQVLQRVEVSGILDTKSMASLGLDPRPYVTGSASLVATLEQHRDGAGVATVNADLAAAKLAVDAASVTKPAGRPATLAATVRLQGQRVVGIDSLRLAADDIQIDGAADFAEGRPDVLKLTRVSLGRAIDAHGEVRVPRSPGAAWQVKVSGSRFDASSQLDRKPQAGARAPTREPPPGPPWQLDAEFDQVVLSEGRNATAVVAHIENDGRLIRRADLTARTGSGVPLQVAIAPQGSGRRLTASTADAGGVLRAFNVLDTMQGGRLSVSGIYDDTRPDHPLTGTVRIDEFRIRNAPALAKLLQAMTLYGLVDAMSGPGLNFTQLVAPFRFASDLLELSDARAFSASLGMTAKGRLDLGRQLVDIQGTIVPAYILNSALGKIPLVGKLFSPERGGGLFAAAYSVQGSVDDPSVSINPLSALTPGFLRGLFGIFDDQGSSGAGRLR